MRWSLLARLQKTIDTCRFFTENTTFSGTSPKRSHTSRRMLNFTSPFSHFWFLKLTSLRVVNKDWNPNQTLRNHCHARHAKLDPQFKYEGWWQKQPHQTLQEVILSLCDEDSVHEKRGMYHLQPLHFTRASKSGGSNVVGGGGYRSHGPAGFWVNSPGTRAWPDRSRQTCALFHQQGNFKKFPNSSPIH